MGTSRTNRAVMARETLAIVEAGGYASPDGGSWLPLGDAIEQAKAGTEVISWDTVASWDVGAPIRTAATQVTVANETTFAAGRRLVGDGQSVCCLNFASAKNPGGGFINGAKAQEEDLAKASALYPCLLEGEEYYKLNRAGSSSLYADLLIYSPQVPVFRDDRGALLTRPWSGSVITCPAPNAGAVRHNEPERSGEIGSVFLSRIELVLEVARHFGERQLVLGAWGCGVFKNDPADCARWFGEVLQQPRFVEAFAKVHFAVLDRSQELATFSAFQREFGDLNE